MAKYYTDCKDGLASAPAKYRSCSDKFARGMKSYEGNQYGELSPDVIRDPLWREGQDKTAKPRPNSPFKRAKVIPVIIRKG